MTLSTDTRFLLNRSDRDRAIMLNNHVADGFDGIGLIITLAGTVL